MPEPIETLAEQSGLPAGGRVFSDALRLSVLPHRATLRLQLGARSRKAAGSLRVAGRAMPVAMNTWNGDDPVFMRLAPDSWLIQSALHETTDLVPAVKAGCGRRAYAVADVSDSLVTISIEGALGASLLARGCGLDFGPGSFGSFACARTRFAQLAVVLRRVNSERFELLVERPAAQWLYEWLEDAAAGIDC
jgi:heterotetrameric sarcosine oxidase gamma subunit